MKIQLDTTNKKIKVEGSVKLSELVKTLEKLLPKKEWEEFTLVTDTVIEYWSSPTIIKEIIREKPHTPWYPNYPWYVCTTQNYTKNQALCLNAGIYNVEA